MCLDCRAGIAAIAAIAALACRSCGSKGGGEDRREGERKEKKQQNPVATWDVRKAKLSTLDKVPFPLVDRKETKSLLQSVILGKALPTFVSFVVAIEDIRAPAHSSCEAGTFAKICLQLKGHEESQTALENLEKEKNILEDAWQVSRPRVASMVLS